MENLLGALQEFVVCSGVKTFRQDRQGAFGELEMIAGVILFLACLKGELMALEVEEVRTQRPLKLCCVLLSSSSSPPVPQWADSSSRLRVPGPRMLIPTPDCHEHGKHNCRLVVNHVGDLEKIKEEHDGDSEGQGLGGWGGASAFSAPMCPPLSRQRCCKKAKEGEGRWGLRVVNSSSVVMEGDHDLAVISSLQSLAESCWVVFC